MLYCSGILIGCFILGNFQININQIITIAFKKERKVEHTAQSVLLDSLKNQSILILIIQIKIKILDLLFLLAMGNTLTLIYHYLNIGLECDTQYP